MVSRADLWHAAVGVVVAVFFLVCIYITCFRKQKRSEFESAKLENGVLNNHQFAAVETNWRRPSNAFRRSNKLLFSWSDNPSLTTDAVEAGWPRFAFTLSPSVRPTSILGMCATGDGSGGALETELSWEIGHGAVDFMQKIRLNPGTRLLGSNSNSNVSPLSVIRTALPLPGPACAFPQEAYVEMIVLSCREQDERESVRIREEERNKLNKENGGSLHRANDSSIDEVRGGGGGVLVAVGLTVGGLLPMKTPGSYPGSIGFISNGSVHHDGNKLVLESEKGEWGMLTGKVIGCGFIPSQKKVFFTIDSELVHTIHCTTEEFGTPLYPTLAANCDITVLVNNGQSLFKYVPANATRRADPCFIGSPFRSGTVCEDSKELFSMGRIDPQWLNRSAPRSSVYAGNGNVRVKDLDEESEVDELFEIILEGNVTSSSKLR
ncbi:unnamed protein product [Rhodiola kirilowii]